METHGNQQQPSWERLEALDQRLAAAESEMTRMKSRLRATWSLAFVGTLGAFVLGTQPEARAQFGVTLTSLQNQINALTPRVTALETKTAPLSVSGNSFLITGKNVFIQDGTGGTASASGLGNLTVGYNESRVPFGGTDTRTGSHNLIVGGQNNYSSSGGLVAGGFNTISGTRATVTGGEGSTASGPNSSVSGGIVNTASGDRSWVGGGQQNTASSPGASASGGAINVASGTLSSTLGGQQNTASGFASAVTGGQGNRAGGDASSVSGGANNTTNGIRSSISGGFGRTIGNTAAEEFDWRAGGLLEGF